jgi:hypothetical protein
LGLTVAVSLGEKGKVRQGDGKEQAWRACANQLMKYWRRNNGVSQISLYGAAAEFPESEIHPHTRYVSLVTGCTVIPARRTINCGSWEMGQEVSRSP